MLVNPAPEGGYAVVPVQLLAAIGNVERIWIARVDRQGNLSQVTRMQPGDTARVGESQSGI